ncbi:MAG: hypothetical protein IJH50_09270 [Kiritimatiellae bacterium]|nr:hypothetical protein [Kiritimatiellia bacterium]
MASKLSKEMIERLRGPSAEGGAPSPYRTPGLEEALIETIEKYPMTWEEKRAASMRLHEMRLAREAEKRRQRT